MASEHSGSTLQTTRLWPSLSSRYIRRPGTRERTGRRARFWPAVKRSKASTGEASSWASTRHATIRHETDEDLVTILNRLLSTLQDCEIPGPQLFRLRKEISQPLGEGGQGNVRCLARELEEQYDDTPSHIQKDWPVKHIAIKQHMKRHVHTRGRQKQSLPKLNAADLCSRIRAAEAEVLALAPGLFRDHPNIVKLVGWGLCIDTIEDPASECCGGLQLPLLVYERAEKNFAQFLQDDVFPRDNPGADDEETLQCGIFPSTHGVGTWRTCFSRLKEVLGLRPDPYETVRSLCLDVGNGLQSLHENQFTHGDLKPENVLIFPSATGWTAKLCDFGCAVARNADEAGDHGDTTLPESYVGTWYWMPPRDELAAVSTFDDLRKCDLFVYGLLVWSSFCLRGHHPPEGPRLQMALEDVHDLAHAGDGRGWSLASRHVQLTDKISHLLRETLCDSTIRDPRPWIGLTDGSEGNHPAHLGSVPSPLRADGNTAVETGRVIASQTLSVRPFLTRQMKATYKEQAWWTPRKDSVIHDVETGKPVSRPEAGPASNQTLRSDFDCLSTELFTNAERIAESRGIGRAMIDCLDRSRWCKGYQLPLYHMARFRSRVMYSPEHWTLDARKGRQNVLGQALGTYPHVDIQTLAWLCSGPVGYAEVLFLDLDVFTRRVDGGLYTTKVFDLLDESQRLERVLLLIDAGARLEKPIRVQHPKGDSRDTTFIADFVESCRNDIISTVIAEICRRLRGRGASPYLVNYFFLSEPGCTSAYKDFGNFEDGIKGKIARQALFQEPIFERSFRKRRTAAAQESTPLVGSASPLPFGWKRVILKSAPGPRRWITEPTHTRTTCYEEEFTHSVSLFPPVVSILRQRQVRVGVLSDDKSLSCQVDLLACERSTVNRELGQDIEGRFPIYDDAWYAEEWNREPNVSDVLGSIREPWGIRTFNALLPAPSENAMWQLKLLWGMLMWFALVLAAVCLVYFPAIGLTIVAFLGIVSAAVDYWNRQRWPLLAYG